MSYLLHGGTIWDNDGSIIRDGAIVIEGEEISEVSTAEEVDPTNHAETLDCDGKLIIPGLVNAHTHLYSTLSRGLVLPGHSPENFLDILRGLWWKLDRNLTEETIKISALIGGIEFLKNGVTTVFDHHSSPGATPESLTLIKDQLIDKLGMRSSLCYEVSDRNGREETQLGIRENLDWLSFVSNNEDHLAGGQFGLHASFTLSTETLEEVASYTEDLDVGIHIHLAEGLEDQQDSLANYGNRVVNRLDNFNLIDQNSILVHGIHLSEPEKNLLGERKPILVHNPRSNMNNAVGVTDLRGLFERDIDVALGNDGMGFDMITEFQAANFLQKIHHGTPNPIDLIQMGSTLFKNNYELATDTFSVEMGKISPGYKADLVVIDYPQPTPLTEENVYGHFIYGFSGNNHRVETVFVNGEKVLADSSVVGFDESEAYERARNLSSSLWKRIKRT